MNLNELSAISANPRNENLWDLQYREKYSKWRFSEKSYARFNLATMGFNLFMHPEGSLVLGFVPENDAQLMRRRKGSESKGMEFTASSMRTLLDSKYPGVNLFCLIHLDTVDNCPYYEVIAFIPEESKTMVEIETTVTIEAPDDSEEDADMIADVEAEADNSIETDEVNQVAELGSMDLAETEVVDETTGEVTDETPGETTDVDDTLDGEDDDPTNLDLSDIPDEKEETVKSSPFKGF